MPNAFDDCSIEIPRVLHERLQVARMHHRQSYGGMVEDMFELWLDHYGYGPSWPPSIP